MTVRARAAAWIVTGPVGHLWSVLADLAVLFSRYGWTRLTSGMPPDDHASPAAGDDGP